MERSAGIVLVRMFEDIPNILCLKIYQSYDFPKGHVEEGEDVLAAARRETFEEAGISNISFPWGNQTIKLMNNGKRKKEVTLFIGATEQEPFIKKNPESGRYEHHGFSWLPLDRAETMLHPYLRPAAGWVRKTIARSDALKEFVKQHVEAV